ncbi:MAG: hypothetical protein ACK47J_20525 [Pseudanabaena sp.]|jgi:hypothetical protein
MTYQKLKRRKIENMKTVVQTDLLNSSPVSSVASDKSIVDPVVIDLLEVANQLASSAKGLQKTALETKKPVFVSVQSILKKLPELEVLPPELAIFRLRATDSIFLADTLNVYELEGQTVIASPDLELLDGFDFVTYKTGINGYTVVSYQGLQLKIGISVSDDHVDELIVTGAKGIDGSGKPDPSYLRRLPQPETPLHSDDLPHNVALTIVATGKTTQRFDTPLVDITDPKGKLYKNVITNSDLSSIATKHGIGAKFKIIGKRARVNKDGQPIDSTGKVNLKKPSYIVQLQDLQGLDFSDLKA